MSPVSPNTGDTCQQFAIVGHSCRFPGGANDPVSLWQLLSDGVDASTEIPKRCFDIDAVYTDAADRSSGFRRMGVRKASVIQDAECFDPTFFNISRREARVMDPQQRQLLQVAHEAVEASGYCPTSPTPSTDPEHFAVYVAAATDDYVANLASQEVDVFYSPATLRAFLAGRISHHFGWEGPSLVVDTACSSSLVALHTACRAIASNDCRSALVCGVNVITSPLTMLGLYRGHFLSKDGRCKTFDASADGYGRAEGVAAFVVKSLQDALDDGDHIEAVIRASAMNQSGLAKSITHPDKSTQMKLFQRIHLDSGVPPSQVSYIEMHGTGTKAGDRCEMSSVAAIYGSGEGPLYIGSVKANMGHAEAAAGFAGLAKVLSMLRTRQIPPQISLKKLNPELEPFVSQSRIKVSPDAAQWSAPEAETRFALVNSFGAAGSNASVLLQEWDGQVLPRYSPTAATPAASGLVFCLSAKNRNALVKLLDGFIEYTERAAAAGLEDLTVERLCYATAARRIHHRGHRLAIPVDPTIGLAAFIDVLKQAKPISLEAPKLPAQPPALFLLLPGNGQLTPAAILAQLRQSPVLDAAFRTVLVDLHDEGASKALAAIAEAPEQLPAQLHNVVAFAYSVALARQWQQLGVTSLHLVAAHLGSLAVAQHALGDVPLEAAFAEWKRCGDCATDPKIIPLRGGPSSCISAGGFVLLNNQLAVAAQPTLASEAKGLVANSSPQPYHQLLAQLWEAGLTIDFARAFHHFARANLPLLPLHTFASERFWVPYEGTAAAATGPAPHSVARSAPPARSATLVPQEPRTSTDAATAYAIEPHPSSDPNGVAYALDLSSVRAEIMGHLVAGRGMCPASVYHELAFTSAAASAGLRPGSFSVALRNARYTAPLVYDEAAAHPGRLICQLVRKEAEPSSTSPRGATFAVTVSSVKGKGQSPPTQHFVGEVVVAEGEAMTPEGSASLTAAASILLASCKTSHTEAVETAKLYAHFASKVVAYSSMYQTIERFQATEDGFQAVATIKTGKLSATNDNGKPWSLNPVLQDTMLHACGYLAHTCPVAVEGAAFIAQSLGQFYTLGGTAARRSDSVRQVVVLTTWDESRASLLCKAVALDAKDEVVAVIQDLAFKRINHRAFGAALSAVKTKQDSHTTQSSSPAQHPSSSVLSALRDKIIAIVAQGTGLPIAKIEGNQTLEELGVDSLLYIEIISAMGRILPSSAASTIGEELSPMDTVDALVAACQSIIVRTGATLGDDGLQAARPAGGEAAPLQHAEATGTAAPVSAAKVHDVALGILAKVLGCDEGQLQENRTSSLADLGLDSLGAIELAEGLSNRLGVGRDAADAYAACESLDAFLEGVTKEAQAAGSLPGVDGSFCDDHSGVQGQTALQDATSAKSTIHDQLRPSDISFLRQALRMESNPTLIRRGGQHNGKRAPVFFCADGSGVPASVLSLPSVQSRDIWTLSHADFFDSPGRGTLSIVEHAALLADAITAAYPHGPLIMAGWSFGGILAWEIAHQLRSTAGREVLGTVAIDSPCPLGHTPLDASVIDSLIPPAAQDSQAQGEEGMVQTVRELMRASFHKAGAAIAAYARHSEASCDGDRLRTTALQAALSGRGGKATSLSLALLRSEDDYRPSKENQRAALGSSGAFDWLTKRTSTARQASAALGWEKVGAGPAVCLAIPGSHFTPFARRNVGAVSDALEQCCARFEARVGGGQLS